MVNDVFDQQQCYVKRILPFGRLDKARKDKRVDGIYFEVEKIWSSCSSTGIEMEYLFKEAARDERHIVLTKQIEIPEENELISFADKSRIATNDALSLRFTAPGLPERNSLLLSLGIKVLKANEKFEVVKDKEVWLNVKESNSSCYLSNDFLDTLNEVLEILSRIGKTKVIISVFELSLTGVPFTQFYLKLIEVLPQWGLRVVFLEQQLVWFDHPMTSHELVLTLSSLKGTSSSQLSESILDFCKIDNKILDDDDDRPVGHVIRYNLPPDNEEVQNSHMVIIHDDFITTARNPVICITADFRPQGSLAKAFLREYRSEERLFNQKKRSGQVATLNLDWKTPTSSIFFCVMRATCRNALFPELFIKCLWNLKNIALKSNLKVLSFPLLDWERSVIPFFQFCDILKEVFSDTDIVLTLYPNYFLSIK